MSKLSFDFSNHLETDFDKLLHVSFKPPSAPKRELHTDEHDPNPNKRSKKETNVFLNGDECGSITIIKNDTYDSFFEQVESIFKTDPREVYKGAIIEEHKEIICYNTKGVISKDNFKVGDIDEHLDVYITAVFCTLQITEAFVNEDELPTLLNRYQNIKKVVVTYCEQITDTGLEHISDNLKNLQSLDLMWCNFITDTGLGYISKLEKLQRLKFYDSKQITDDGLEHISKLPQLKVLDLSCCRKITDTGLEHISTLPQLEKLYLSKCYQITYKAVRKLQNKNIVVKHNSL